jgi:hypothetical protein
MKESPFLALVDEDEERRILSVPPGHEGFVRHDTGRLHLRPGVHRLQCGRAAAVFLVRVEGSHVLDLRSLGGVMVRASTGRWRPLKVLGQLVYGVARPEQLVDFLEREQIHESEELERELARLTVDLLANVFDGDALHADKLVQSLEEVSSELLRRLTVIVLPLGLRLDGLDLLAAPAPLDGMTAAPGVV